MEFHIVTFNLGLDSLPVIAICFLVIGFVLNINKKLHCWTCWLVCSTLWLIYGLLTNQVSLCIQNMICIGFHIFGFITWSNHKKVLSKKSK